MNYNIQIFYKCFKTFNFNLLNDKKMLLNIQYLFNVRVHNMQL